ncbi:CHAT domain-containing protein [Dactylosporangium sp. CA-139066]|uniref:CHAT domain-containing protein n=1 Tax=Dactylosporangium sp. CA-139066 TaxID=3239930 RepID=UPI003D92B7EA
MREFLRKGLIVRLEGRLHRYVDRHDPSVLLDPRALREADALLQASAPGGDLSGMDLRTANVLATFHWIRWASGSEDPQRDLALTLALFSVVYAAAPDMVPESIAEALTAPDGDEPDDNDLAVALVGEFERTGDIAHLNRAIDVLHELAADASAEAGHRLTVLSNLAIMVEKRFYHTGSSADLDTVPELWRTALTVLSADQGRDPDEARAQRARYLSSLGIALRNRADVLGGDSDAEEAVAVSRQAVELTPESSVEYPRYLVNLAVALRRRYDARGDAPALVQATEALDEALRAAAADHPDRDAIVSSLGNTWWTWFRRTGSPDDLTRAIGHLEQAVALNPARYTYLSNLGVALRDRFVVSQDPADLGRAVDVLRRAADIAGQDPSLSADALNLLAANLSAQSEDTGAVSDVDEAIAVGERALALTVPGDPQRSVVLNTVGVALRRRYERAGREEDVDRAVSLLREAAGNLPAGHPVRSMCLSNLCGALQMRFKRTGALDDIDGAVDAGRLAVADAGPANPHRAMYLSSLGLALTTRFDRTGAAADLAEAVEAGRAARDATPPGHPDRATSVSNLGVTYLARFDRTGDEEALDGAIETSREAAEATPVGHPDRRIYLSTLGSALRTRAHRTGRLADLDEAVQVGRRAVAEAAADHPSLYIAVANLATALNDRFEHTGDLDDLDEAIRLGRDAADATPPDRPDRASLLGNLGVAWRSRFRHTGDPADLDQAVRAGQEALEHTAPDDADRWRRQSNAGLALLDRFGVTGDRDDLDAAVALKREALAACPADHADRFGLLSTLGLALRRRGGPGELNRAIDLIREAVAGAPADAPSRAGYATNLGFALKDRFDATGQRADLDEAVACWRAAAAAGNGPIEVRVRAAHAWGTAAAQVSDAPSATDGFATAVRLLPLLTWPGLDREVRERQLTAWPGIGSDAAAWAIRSGDPCRAVELLEQGRSIMWSQAFQTRGDFAELHATAPELGRRLDEVRSALDSPRPAHSGELERGVREDGARSHRRLVEQWDALVEQVRRLPGFGNFLGPTPFEELRPAGDDGPVVLVNVSEYGCAALVLTAGDLRVVELPALTVENATGRADALLTALQAAAGSRRAAPLLHLRQVLLETLDWLAGTVVEPVLAAVDGTRVWWCPTGPLTLLPLHAADRSGAVVSSYTPTLAALLRARTPAAATGPGRPAAVLVGMPETPGQPDLPAVRGELDAVRALVPSAVELVGPDATRARVLASLVDADWAHLSCHGAQDLLRPNRGALYLHDGPLTVAEVAQRHLRHATLAFLSACQTATGGAVLLDEAIHLGAAMQFAGYRHVVATLWSIADEPAPLVAKEFYAALLAGEGPATALHRAVAPLRSAHPNRPELWAPYVHLGGHHLTSGDHT